MKAVVKTVAALGAATFFLSVPQIALTQVAVEESRNRVFPITAPQGGERETGTAIPQQSDTEVTVGAPLSAAPAPVNPQAEMFYQVQLLQQEVAQLRGLLEEQSYEIKRLKQQRLDDYMNLDRRLSELTQTGTGNVPAVALANSATTAEQPVNPELTAADETADYRAAIDLLLTKKDYEGAVTAFESYIEKYPQGRYTVNSQYWLGEVALLNGKLDQAKNWFSGIVEGDPTHSKYQDAKYKLATVVFKQGDKESARTLLEQVAEGNSNAARLASEFLKTQF